VSGLFHMSLLTEKHKGGGPFSLVDIYRRLGVSLCLRLLT